MLYSKHEFVDALRAECEGIYDVVKTARWAYGIFLEHSGDLEAGLQPFIMKVVAMEEGEEFELTKEQLLEEAEALLGNATR